MSEERKRILQMVESGRISAEEGAQLLELVSGTEPEDAEAGPTPVFTESEADRHGTEPQTQAQPTDAPLTYWLYPFWGGALMIVLGGAVVSAAVALGRERRLPGGTWICGWLPLFLGLLVVSFSAWARNAHWIHLSVNGEEHHISLKFPLPLRLGLALLHVARRFVPKLRDVNMDEALLALQAGLRDGQPLSIDVEDEDDGEQVHVEIR